MSTNVGSAMISRYLTIILATITFALVFVGLMPIIGARAAGVDYVCGYYPNVYSIVIEPKDRTFTSFNGITQTHSTVFVPKGITIYGPADEQWTVKTLPRNKHGKVAVRGKTCIRAE
jgi:hypothetical protein